MSIAQMSLAWRLRGISPTQKLVLLSLADNANDQGECYPSIAHIAARTCLSERAVRDAVRALEGLGAVRSEARKGTSTVYFLALDGDFEVSTPRQEVPTAPAGNADPITDVGEGEPRQEMPPAPAAGAAPAGDAGGQQLPPTPARDAPPPRQQVPPTPAAPAPKPSLNRQGNRHLTVNNKARAKSAGVDATVLVAMDLPDWLPRQSWADWVEHRVAVKVPLTQRAADLAIRHLGRLRDGGNDPVAVIEQSVRSGKWTDLYPVRDRDAGGARQRPLSRQEQAEQSHQEFLRLTGGGGFDSDDGRTIDMEAAHAGQR